MMSVNWLNPVIVGLALVTRSVGVAQVPAQDQSLPFSCATFSPDVSAADLRERFGEEHVQTARVPWGGAEGDYNEGTVLFGDDPNAKLEIFWRDTTGKRNPGWVSVRGDRSRWRTPAGVTLGTHLQVLETVNAGPFRLLGFGTDVSGTVMSWSNGRLAAQDSAACRVRLHSGRHGRAQETDALRCLPVDRRTRVLIGPSGDAIAESVGLRAVSSVPLKPPANRRLQPAADLPSIK
jgi:hypothetical protein